MSKRSLADLIELARQLLKQHGTLSTAYLMRKFKIDYAESFKIMVHFELQDPVVMQRRRPKEKTLNV